MRDIIMRAYSKNRIKRGNLQIIIYIYEKEIIIVYYFGRVIYGLYA